MGLGGSVGPGAGRGLGLSDGCGLMWAWPYGAGLNWVELIWWEGLEWGLRVGRVNGGRGLLVGKWWAGLAL